MKEKKELKTLDELMEIYEMRGIVPLRKEAIKWIKALKMRNHELGNKKCQKCGRKMVYNYEGEKLGRQIQEIELGEEVHITCPKWFEYKGEDIEKEDYDTFVHSDEIIPDELKWTIAQIMWIKYFFNIKEEEVN